MSDLSNLSDDQLQSLLDHPAPEYKQGRVTNTGPLASLPVPLPGGSTDPTNGMSDWQLVAAGAGRGTANVGRHLANLTGFYPDSKLAEADRLDAPLLATGAGKFGSVLGEAAPLAIGTMGGEALAMPTTIGARVLTNPVIRGITEGAGTGALMSDPGERLPGALVGAATGGALPLVGSTGKKLAYGINRSPEANSLLGRLPPGTLTPGQLNPTGAANQFEQAAESIPGVKQIVHGARDNAEQEYQRSIVQSAAAPGSQIPPSENLHKMLQDAYDSYGPLYDQAKGYPIKPVIMNANGPDVPLSDAINQATKTPGMTPAVRRSVSAWLTDRMGKLGSNADSGALIDLRSDIRARARQMNLSSAIDAKDAAGAYEQAADAVTQVLRSQLPADALSALDKADSNYGVYKIVENAVAKSKDNIAGLTPQKLSQAIYESISDPQYARGAGGPLRDLAQSGTKVFQTVSPPTGARVATLGAGLGAAFKAPYVAIPAATALLGLTGTNVGRRFAAGQTTLQQAAQRALQGASSRVPSWAPGIAGATARQLVNRGVPAYLSIEAPWVEASRGQP